MNSDINYIIYRGDILKVDTTSGIFTDLTDSSNFSRLYGGLFYINEPGVIIYNGNKIPVKQGEVIYVINGEPLIIRDEAFALNVELILQAASNRSNKCDECLTCKCSKGGC